MTTIEAAAAADQGWLATLVDWVVGLMGVIGPYGAGLGIALENLFPPLPSEAILPLAGLAAHRGEFALWEAILWTTIGSLVGALVLYGIGAWFGLQRLRWVADKLPLVSVDDVDRTVAWFHRHGGKAVFFGRFVPIFRSLISIPAGVVRMPLVRFSVYTTIGSLIWNTLFVMLGWYLGEAWHVIEQYMDVIQNIVIVVVLVAVAWFVVVRVRSLRRDRDRDGGSTPETPEAPETPLG